MAIPTCSSCGARILWATTTTGKAMPIDVVPAVDGNVRLAKGGAPSGGLLAEVLTTEQRADYRGTLYVSHFATCAHAKEHRR